MQRHLYILDSFWTKKYSGIYMPELVGFQTMVILDPYGMTFDAVGVFGVVFWLLFKSSSSYYASLLHNSDFCFVWFNIIFE